MKIQYWNPKMGFGRETAPKASMPCKKLRYCPYGPLVEQYPLLQKPNIHSCKIYGHQCPVYYAKEKI